MEVDCRSMEPRPRRIAVLALALLAASCGRKPPPAQPPIQASPPPIESRKPLTSAVELVPESPAAGEVATPLGAVRLFLRAIEEEDRNRLAALLDSGSQGEHAVRINRTPWALWDGNSGVGIREGEILFRMEADPCVRAFPVWLCYLDGAWKLYRLKDDLRVRDPK